VPFDESQRDEVLLRLEPSRDDTLTLFEPADYAYDPRWGTMTSSCTSAVGTTLGVAAAESWSAA
jgi:hypothetical protein